MCVTSLLCGLWADLWPLMGCAVNGFLSRCKVYLYRKRKPFTVQPIVRP